ncbi:4-hydroxythreonine-4-phosphate dehydrogenase PdxA [Methylocystis bryophila]|uniref:4-hydroxythreonine-4-phosphate dehydrogenase n=1 Tax=Methylocystis bryophila TaxID=655015 RepID=A0A1W6N0F9_9HYPH|nr:4-hydroxythreonine-4-phosphate dehydrogenase PdxA [Methylocystis bryophila]ARN83312.1 4-hydroxythreonine-4-phosphate dehydrogenase PdxA [Methylocystis bryophila]
MIPLPLALTQGDPSGIGPEIALKSFAARKAQALPPFFALGDPELYRRVAQALALDVAVEETTPREANEAFESAFPVVPLGISVKGEPGESDAADAALTIRSIEAAVECVAKGEARGIVTAPIAKAALYAAGFAHPGHTEFLGALAKRFFDVEARPVMMLYAEELAVVPITIHVALREAPRLLTRELIVETGRIVAKDYARRFGIARPRLAFAGLNPHAGEGGAMGREEIDVLAPGIAELQAEGIDAQGPFPADTLFHARARERYDVALCPTHDQALIPIKTLAFDRGVNVTLGLPFIRTSPDHGTAFDIAGRGVADATSLIEAIRLAGRLQA